MTVPKEEEPKKVVEESPTVPKEEEPKKVVEESPSPPPPNSTTDDDVLHSSDEPPPPPLELDEKTLLTPDQDQHESPDHSKAIVVHESNADTPPLPSPPPPSPSPSPPPPSGAIEEEHLKDEETKGSTDRDIVLARLSTEKKLAIVKAWEESEKAKAENRALKKISSIGAWQETQKAEIEAEMKKLEEKLERKKAGYAEKMKNKIAVLHRETEEKRAIVEARRGEDILKAEEMAAKYRATGTTPKKGWFSATLASSIY